MAQRSPYLECNPLDAKVSTGPWACLDGLSGMGMSNMPKPPADYPASCAAHYKGGEDFCLQGFGQGPQGQPVSAPAADLGACCATASSTQAQSYNFFPGNKSCELYKFAFRGTKCDGAIAGVAPPPPPPP